MLERELERVRARAGGSMRPISLHRIDAIVTEHLGPARVRGNARPAIFYRQIAMSGSSHGDWSTTAIGKFYNGRGHSTVCHAITRIEFLRRSDQGVTAIIDGLAHACEHEEALASNGSGHLVRLHRLDPVLGKTDSGFIDQLANGIAAPVLARLDSKERTRAILRREDETGSSAKAFYASGDGKAGVTTKKALHQLVDELPDEQAELARQFLEDLRQASGGEGPPLDS